MKNAMMEFKFYMDSSKRIPKLLAPWESIVFLWLRLSIKNVMTTIYTSQGDLKKKVLAVPRTPSICSVRCYNTQSGTWDPTWMSYKIVIPHQIPFFKIMEFSSLGLLG